jgi:hypothetical protein
VTEVAMPASARIVPAPARRVRFDAMPRSPIYIYFTQLVT